MKVNSYILIIMIVLVSSPIITINQATFPNQTNISTNNFDSAVSVKGGETLKYTIDALDWPSSIELPPGFILPNMVGNQMVQKIMLVDPDYEFDETTHGTMIYISIGLLFTKDTAFTVNISSILTEFIIPNGAAIFTGSIMGGVPHFNTTYGGGIMLLVLNDDWAEHEVLAEGMGFDVTSTSSEFQISMDIDDGHFEYSWRKSDGIATHMLIDNCVAPIMNWNMTGGKLEVSLASKNMNGLGVYEGQVIDLKAEEIDLEVLTTGFFTSPTFTSSISEMQSIIDDMRGEVVERVIIDEIAGTYYKVSVYLWDIKEGKLQRVENQIIFNGFLGGGMLTGSDNPLYDGYQDTFSSSLGPVITPDWGIYDGYMILGNTVFNVYIEELLTFFEIPEEEIMIHSASASFDLTLQKDFYYFQTSINFDYEQNNSDSVTLLIPNYSYEVGMQIKVNVTAWLAYTTGGVFAGLGMKIESFADVYDSISIENSGTMKINAHIRLVNPDYNPPDPKSTGGIPGYTFLIALPVLFGLTTLVYIIRKRK